MSQRIVERSLSQIIEVDLFWNAFDKYQNMKLESVPFTASTLPVMLPCIKNKAILPCPINQQAMKNAAPTAVEFHGRFYRFDICFDS